MSININNPFIKVVFNMVNHYNHEKYWKMRKEVINSNSKVPKLIRLYYLFRIKRMDAFNKSSMGTGFGYGATFETPPILAHGLNGIIISPYAKIGKNCTIYQQVTIAEYSSTTSATIGDNCVIGAGAKIVRDVTIGNNVKIGANAVVTADIPDNCTVVGIPAKIVKMNGKKVSSY